MDKIKINPHTKNLNSKYQERFFSKISDKSSSPTKPFGVGVKIGINASFLRKPNTGIGQVTANFLKKLAISNSPCLPAGKQFPIFKNKEVQFVLYLEEDLPKGLGLPKNPASPAGGFEKRIFLPPYKRDDLIRKIWWEKFLLPRRVRKDRCDVLISMYQCPTILSSGVKHIMLVHDIIPKIFPEYLNNSRKKLYQRLTEKAIQRADKIVAVSKRTEKDLITQLGIKGEKITVSYIDVDESYKKKITQKEIARVLKKYKLKPGYIFAGGGMEVRKNVEGVLRAYKVLKNGKIISNLPKLAIYGKLLPELYPLAVDVEKLARELNLTREVRFLGPIPQKDMPALFAGAEMFVYPSRYEGFGMPVLEAMNMGIPVVTSKKASLPEVGWDGVLYCDPDDVHDIAMVMKNILTRKDLRETLSRKACQRAKQFSWNKFVKKILNIIEGLI